MEAIVGPTVAIVGPASRNPTRGTSVVAEGIWGLTSKRLGTMESEEPRGTLDTVVLEEPFARDLQTHSFGMVSADGGFGLVSPP